MIWDEITDALVGAFRSFCLSLCDTIYRLIIFCFNVFEKVGNAKLLDNDAVTSLYEKIGLILGIYMIFRLVFVAVQYVVDPDAMADKQKGAGKIFAKVIIVIVLLGTTPFIFDTAYRIQESITKENVLGKIFLDVKDNSNFGTELSWYLFSTFYKETSESISENGRCPEFTTGIIENDFLENNSLKYTYNCINQSAKYNDVSNGESSTYVIEFDGILAVLSGAGMLWIIVMYTISVGFRLVQLAFLELIAPIPIMMYLEPKNDGPFQKWVKQCISCYLDYFIRTAIIYFICFIVRVIMDSDTSYFFTTLGTIDETEYKYITIIVIFGLLMFAKKLPDLIKDIMPSGGSGFSDYGFSFKKRTENMLGGKQIFGLASTLGKASTVGLAGAAVTGAVGFLGGRGAGRLTGLIGGAGRGLVANSKSGSIMKNLSGGIKSQRDINSKKIDWYNNGSTWYGRMGQRINNVMGIQGEAERYDNDINSIDRTIESYQNGIAQSRRKAQSYQEISDTKSKMLEKATSKLLEGTIKQADARYTLQQDLLGAKAKLEYLQQNGGSVDQIRDAQIAYNNAVKRNSEAYVNMVLNGSFKDDASMNNLVTHLNNVIDDDHDGAFVGLNTSIKNYAELDTFESNVSGKNNILSEEIAKVERAIKVEEDNKKAITSSARYRSANANRDAVGGHKGSRN